MLELALVALFCPPPHTKVFLAHWFGFIDLLGFLFLRMLFLNIMRRNGMDHHAYNILMKNAQ